MGFIPLICRCYMFLYIRLPFKRNFWEVPKYTLFASQKKRDLGFHRYGIPSYFSFPKQSFIEPHTVISEVYFNNRVFHSLIFGVIFTILGVILCFLGVISLALSIILYLLGVILGVIPNFLSTFFMFLVHFFLSTFGVFCPPSWLSSVSFSLFWGSL